MRTEKARRIVENGGLLAKDSVLSILERLEASELRVKQLERNQELNLKIKQAMHERFTRAEAELAATKHQVLALAADNSSLSRYFSAYSVAVNHWNTWADTEDKLSCAPETPATDAAIREIRAQAIDYASGELQSLATRADDVVAERYIDFAAIYLMGMSKKLRSGEQP